MAAEKWLEEELAELDQAEQFIQQAMSDFLPNNISSSDVQPAEPPKKKEVTTSYPKVHNDIDNLTNQLIVGLDTEKKKDSLDGFDLPPPPDLDDLIINKKEDLKNRPLPPPPPLANDVSPPPVQAKKAPPAMSKSTPPPVLPKPLRSTALKASTKTAATDKPKTEPEKPSLNDKSAAKPPPPSSTMPKDIQKNSVEELDFLTSNLLSNMEHPRDDDFYGYCEKCRSVVEGENVGCNALGGVYHIKCFVCETCEKELHGEPFYAVGKTPYCEACYIETLEICTVCLQPITERILRAAGKPYHPECFKCCDCGKSLDGIPFTTDEADNIYCVECYHQKFAPRCYVCGLAILPEPGKEETVRVIALDRSYHITCYCCEKCKIQLSSEKGCYPIDYHIYCLQCNTALMQEKAIA